MKTYQPHKHILKCLLFLVCLNTYVNAQKKIIIPTGHRAIITAADWSADGSLLVTASKDGNAILWDANNFKELRNFSAHRGWIRNVLFTKDMKKILTVGKKSISRDSSEFIIIWEVQSGKKLQEIEVRDINSKLSLSVDGNSVIYLNGTHGVITTIKLSTGEKTSYSNDLRAVDVAFLQDEKTAVTLGNTSKQTYDESDGSFIHIWAFANPKAPKVLPIEHGSALSSVSISVNGTKILAGYFDGTIRLFDLPGGKLLMQKKIGNSAIKRTSLSDDASHFAVVDEQKKITTGLVANSTSWVSWKEKEISQLSISKNGKRLLIGIGLHYGKIFETATGKVKGLLSGNTLLLSSEKFSSDNHKIVIGTAENGNYVLDIASGKLLKAEQNNYAYESESTDRMNELQIDYRKEIDFYGDIRSTGDYSFMLLNKLTGKAIAMSIFDDGGYMLYNTEGEFEFSENARKLLYNVTGTKISPLLPDEFLSKKGVFKQFIATSTLTHLSLKEAPSIEIKPITQKDLLPELNVVIPNPKQLSFTSQIYLNGRPLAIQNDSYLKETNELRYSFNLLKYFEDSTARWGAKNVIEVKLYDSGRPKTFVTSALSEFNIIPNKIPKLIIASGHSARITAITASKDGRFMLSGDENGYVKYWDLNLGMDIKNYHVGESAVQSIKLSADGKYMITDALQASHIAQNKHMVTELQTGKTLDSEINRWGDLFSFYPGKDIYFKRGSRSYISLINKKETPVVPENNVRIEAVAYSANGKLGILDISEIVKNKWVAARVFVNGKTGKQIHKLAKQSGSNLTLSSDGSRYFDTNYSKSYISVYNTKTYKKIAEIELNRSENINDVCFSEGANKIIASTLLGYRIIYDLATKRMSTDSTWVLTGTSASFSSSTGKNFFTGDQDGMISIINLEKKQVAKKFPGRQLYNNNFALNHKTGTMYLSKLNYSKTAYLLSFKPGERYKTLEHEKIIGHIGFSPDHNKILTAEYNGKAYVWDLASATKLNQINKGGSTIALANYREDGTIRVLLDSVINGKHLGLMTDNIGNTTRRGLVEEDFRHIYKDKNHEDFNIISLNSSGIAVTNGVIYFRKKQSADKYDIRNVTAALVLFKDGEWILYSPDGYFTGSRNASKLLAYELNGKIHSFDQYDLQFNRADIMLERIGLATKEDAEVYKKAYLKRVKSLGFDHLEFSAELIFDAPDINITNAEQLRNLTSQKQANLQVTLTDSQFKLKNYNVYVNNVPLFPGTGKPIDESKSQLLKIDLEIPLGYGKNTIEITAYNEKGVQGSSENLELYNNEQPGKPNLYLVTIGAGKYDNPKLNLQYPAKDAADIAKIFAASSLYQKVMVKSLTEDSVTVDNVLALKQWLLNTKIDDKVIVFYAGHGVRNDNKDYYLGTRNMDFAYPEKNGIAYEQLESLMDGIPSRSKMIAIDACYAGEADKEDIEQQQTSYVSQDDVKLRSAGNKSAEKKTGRGSNMNLLKELFVDIRKKTGTTVIASSGAVESARESNTWNNSVFTYCLSKALKDKAADFDQDGKILISELQKYLEIHVPALTNNLQKPTSRIENFANDFAIW